MGALMAFRVGQEVVCVDDNNNGQYDAPGYKFDGQLDGLTRGQVYTVREIVACPLSITGVGVRLNEIVRPREDTPYCDARFRPIVKTDISIFEAMLAPSPKQRVDA